MTRQLPIVFSQLDFLQNLGTSTNSIAGYGCYLTSFTNIAFACGKQITPPQLNKLFVQNNLFVQGDLIAGDDVLTKIYPDIKYVQTYHYETIPADLNQLKTLVSDPTNWVSLEIDLDNGNTHFVLCVGVNGVVSIADPEGGIVIDFSSKYGDPARNILKFVVYSGIPVNTDSSALTSLQNQIGSLESQVLAANNLASNKDQTIAQLQERLNQNETNYQAGLSDLTTKNEKLNAQVNQLLEDAKQREAAIASSTDLANEVASKNVVAVEQGIKAKNILDEIKIYLYNLADALHLKSKNMDDPKQVIIDILDAVIEEGKKIASVPQINNTPTPPVPPVPTVSMAVKGQEVKKKRSIWQFLGLLK